MAAAAKSSMVRAIKKQVIIKEMTFFLKIPNGEEIVIDYYERMRKYSNCSWPLNTCFDGSWPCVIAQVLQGHTTR
jgi:hypothetical protein